MNPVKSAQRTLAILELMERMRRPARISEIAKLLGYPQSSTSVLINSLCDLGYINLNRETHEYSPSIRVALVGGYLRFDGMHAFQVLDLISAVRDRTRHTTILSTRNGNYVQYMYALVEPGLQMLGLRAGNMRPLTRAAPGIMLLTECSDAEIGMIAKYLYNTLPNPGDNEQLDNLLAKVEQARAEGYACLLGQLVSKVGSVAVPLPFRDSFGKQLVLSVSGLREDIEPAHAELVEIMQSEIARHCQAALKSTTSPA